MDKQAAPSPHGEQRQFPFCFTASAARRPAPSTPTSEPAARAASPPYTPLGGGARSPGTQHDRRGAAGGRPGSACLTAAPPCSAPLGSAGLGRSLLAPPLALAPPSARSPRLAPPLEPGLEARRCSGRAVKGRGKSAAAGALATAGGPDEPRGEGRGASAAELEWMADRWFRGIHCYRLENRGPHVSVPPSGWRHGSAVSASPGIRQARRDALLLARKARQRARTFGFLGQRPAGISREAESERRA
ncbi:homeobox protein goosecoid-2-like [Sagmatias obliquidens]|uniref:homeobox protein goosecoid-2-like n=1 Tax=Sagmatias obliquidens TaxID=3371155 RepID=UPI000F440B39|nr:homeobox protein goosecoid-2-like [Lagenorhynchus obliquidens]